MKQFEPQARVVLCEAGRCGDGPSGRNGGFVNGLWFSLPTLRERFGDEAAIEVAHAAQARSTNRRLLRGAGRRRLVSPGRLPAGLHRAGLGRRLAEPAARACAELGVPEACQPIDARPRSAAAAPRRSSAAEPSIRAPRPCSRRGSARGLAKRVSGRGRGRLRAHARPVGRAGAAMRSSPRPTRGRVRAGAAVLASGARRRARRGCAGG